MIPPWRVQPQPGRLLFWWGVLCALSLGLALAPRSAQAAPLRPLHAQYDHSIPAANARLPSGQAPRRVTVWFTERIEAAFSELQVWNQRRQRVDLRNSRAVPGDPYALVVDLPPHLPDGAYTVLFHNVSAEDGHEVTGSFGFVVGAGPLPSNTDALLSQFAPTSANLNAWSVSARWLNILGLCALAGLPLFLLYVWRPGVARIRQQVGGPELAAAERLLQRLSKAYLLAILLALSLGWLAFWGYQSWIFSGLTPWQLLSSQNMLGEIVRSRFGIIWLARLALLLLAWCCWGLVLRRRHGWWQSWPLKGLLPLIGLLMLAEVLNSHAAASRQALLLLPLDLLHLLASAAWIGTLLALIVLLPPALSKLRPGTGDRTRLLASLIRRFTRLAVPSVLLLALAGGLEALLLLPSLASLISSDYGRALLGKTLAFALLLLLGAINGFLIGPRLRQLARQPDRERGAASFTAGRLQRLFVRAVRGEGVVALLLLVIVGVLTSLSPPVSSASVTTGASQGPLLYQGRMGDLSYSFIINPGQVGTNTFAVDLHDSTGRPLSLGPNDSILLRCTMTDMVMGIQEITLSPVAGQPGRYRAIASSISMGGHWRLTLIVRRLGFDDVSATFNLTIAAPAASGSAPAYEDLSRWPGLASTLEDGVACSAAALEAGDLGCCCPAVRGWPVERLARGWR
ncbi:MAG: copper resistance protein CopC [Thermogemmatispora sp.]|uniref:copper resistance protein CopC n=1 Tax=Thermogemmatispora sp. TaxID=1968838 RepID=UPI0026083DBE|nr:copper resistance protein CopC [Thermogemmatispora sp.]MBX5457667.1 copper resistance protein CopC [Thermogemmatispora sp.]